ncbi:MAG: hypothetical protein IJO85_10525 [Lachnospiraceae bacterium]|nr:hypothetical protein [Lachnospiraceae bacterium]
MIVFQRKGYKFTKKKNPQQGIMASILGVIANASIVLAVYLTYQNKGVAPMQYGTVILLSLIFALVGLGIGIRSCLEKDIYRLFPVLGIILNSVAILAGGFILYLGV